MKSNCQNNNILFSIYKNNIFIKAEGHITANLCFSLREYLYREIPNMDPTFDVFVDLNNTDYMDSTFLGLLIGIEKRLYNNFKKHLHIINLCKLAIDLFDNMELENFFKIEKKEIPKEVIFKKFNESIEIDEIEKLKTIFTSHQDLSSISNKNQEKFKKLQDILQKQINDKCK